MNIFILDATSVFWFYMGGALSSMIFQLYTRATTGLGPPIVVDRWHRRPTALRAISFAKGIVWGLLWPLMWLVLITASYRSRPRRRFGEPAQHVLGQRKFDVAALGGPRKNSLKGKFPLE
jgi:hypothetical protein